MLRRGDDIATRALDHDGRGGQHDATTEDTPTMTLPRPLAVAAVAALVGLTAACGATTASPDPASTAPATADAPAGPTVTLQDIAFHPNSLTVEAGETVTWVWQDGAIEHDVSGEGFSSELKTGGRFTHTFTEAGTYQYECTVHPNMTGTIEVTA